MSHINCTWANIYMDTYFGNKLSYVLQDYLYEHLLECKECYEKYKTKAAEIGLSFNLRERALDFAIEHGSRKKICYTKDILVKLGFKNDLEVLSNKWSRVAEKVDIERLMELRAFSDFSEEEMTVRCDNWDDDLKAIYQYTKWFAVKLCKDIDHLNRCYLIGNKLEDGGITNEKS